MNYYRVEGDGDTLIIYAAWGRIRAEVHGVPPDAMRQLLAARSDEEVLSGLPAEVRDRLHAIVLDVSKARH